MVKNLWRIKLGAFPEYAREQKICIQPRPSRASRKRRLKKGKGSCAWPRGKEPDCSNSLWYYTRSLNSQQPPKCWQTYFKESDSIWKRVTIFKRGLCTRISRKKGISKKKKIHQALTIPEYCMCRGQAVRWGCPVGIHFICSSLQLQ